MARAGCEVDVVKPTFLRVGKNRGQRWTSLLAALPTGPACRSVYDIGIGFVASVLRA
jgi:hypothetical protein